MSLSPLSRARALVADNRRMVGKLVVVDGADVRLRLRAGADLPHDLRGARRQRPRARRGAERRRPSARSATRRSTSARTVTIEFDANARGPWDFKPAQATVDVHPGELTTVMYEFRNRQNRTMAAQAFPSYAPSVAMAHFKKLECFCFTEHVLKPGESKQWPVVFVVDRKLPKDVRTITLVVHVLRGRRQDAGRARRVGAGRPGTVAGQGGLVTGERRRSARSPADARPRSLRTLLAVVWSFFGVRKSKDLERDVSELEPAARRRRRRRRRGALRRAR